MLRGQLLYGHMGAAAPQLAGGGGEDVCSRTAVQGGCPPPHLAMGGVCCVVHGIRRPFKTLQHCQVPEVPCPQNASGTPSHVMSKQEPVCSACPHPCLPPPSSRSTHNLSRQHVPPWHAHCRTFPIEACRSLMSSLTLLTALSASVMSAWKSCCSSVVWSGKSFMSVWVGSRGTSRGGGGRGGLFEGGAV